MFFNMRNVHLLTLSGMAMNSVASAITSAFDFHQTTLPTTTCNFFKQNFSNITLLPEDTGYTAENEGAFIL
jgi:hypothetical protein